MTKSKTPKRTAGQRLCAASGSALRLQRLDVRLTKLVATANELRKKKETLKRTVRAELQKRAEKIALYRIGDILEYTDGHPPILVTKIECYESGEPNYRGLQVCNGKLTRNVRSTAGWGDQNPYTGGDGKRYPSNWKKVGDCSQLRLVVPNAPLELQAERKEKL